MSVKDVGVMGTQRCESCWLRSTGQDTGSSIQSDSRRKPGFPGRAPDFSRTLGVVGRKTPCAE